MKFVYKPEGVSDEDAHRWDFDPAKLMNVEAEVIERRTGMTFAEWTGKVRAGSMLALHGLLYVLLKRERPTLKWDEVVFNIGECDFELSDEETADVLDELEEQERTDRLDSAGQGLLALLRAEAAQRDPVPDAGDGDDGDDGKSGVELVKAGAGADPR